MSTGYNQKTSKNFEKKLVKGIKIFHKKKEKKCQYAHERNRNLPEDEKKRLVECRKNYFKYKIKTD